MKKLSQNARRVLSLVAVLLVLTLLLLALQELLLPKYRTEVTEGALIGEYYRETTAHDVLFVGDCEAYYRQAD